MKKIKIFILEFPRDYTNLQNPVIILILYILLIL